MKKILAAMMALLMLFTCFPAEAVAAGELEENTVAAGDLQTDDTFYLGSYPQTLITDTQLIIALNALDMTMQSYGYLVNVTEDVCMKYGDVMYQGKRYRKVTIGDTYRPRDLRDARNSGSAIHDHINSGYQKNRSYWFVWEPVKWQVLHHTAEGLTAMTDMLLDAQYFHNASADQITWKDSFVRSWLNSTMFESLFSENEQTKLVKTDVKNPGNLEDSYYTGYTEDTLDYLWLLDISEITDENGFGNKTVPADSGGIRILRKKLFAYGTDYGFCQGLIQGKSYSFSGCSYLTRTMAVHNISKECRVCSIIENSDFGYDQHAYITYTRGVRPCITLDKNALVSLTAEIDEELPCTHPNTLTRVTKPASFQLDGIRQTVCAGCGQVLKTEKISGIETVQLAKKSVDYTGYEQHGPSVTVTDSDGKVIPGTDYTISYISRADGKETDTVKDVGQYKLHIAFHGDYSGSRELYFSLRPENAIITEAALSDGACSVNWKPSSSFSGYEVELSTTPQFAFDKLTYDTENGSQINCRFRMPAYPKNIITQISHPKYYVRIRTYQKIMCDGIEAYMYSSWSKPYVVSQSTVKKHQIFKSKLLTSGMTLLPTKKISADTR